MATGSMDNTAKLWDVNPEKRYSAGPHRRDRVLEPLQDSRQVITGSFDHTIKLWDVGTGKCIHTLSGHHGEISSTQFNFSSELCISGSIDRTCKIWNVKTGQCLQALGYNDEIWMPFNAAGASESCNVLETPSFCPFLIRVSPRCFLLFLSSDSNLQLVTASADGTSRVYNTQTGMPGDFDWP